MAAAALAAGAHADIPIDPWGGDHGELAVGAAPAIPAVYDFELGSGAGDLVGTSALQFLGE
ncbi:hypothetical protein TRAPUB_7251 [Trametes pubescens]|uniref:Uncharacterized protein n=1 Tax=Trametes pubescens TaxID=154538 RepID=A0A1M2V3T6_TRAPU|nr:hypothetical protein TRAPUB_7251 [Trametes pubescens]